LFRNKVNFFENCSEKKTVGTKLWNAL